MRPKVEFQLRRAILPPDLFQKCQGMDFWRTVEGSQANGITAQRTEPEPAAEDDRETDTTTKSLT
ncbi:hypothetical protein [Thiorhodococcus mannitoliphagus]|uniref:hypothetical protein n=1 Tax=Thiorhodococcus mannitoliphagus TaxID=329406 RepID=UPI00197EB9DA|nr:hypothetical protein [Thiorhodococcus mannitoliphagus]